MTVCPRCGASADGTKPYCTNCGAPLSIEGAEPAPQAAPRPFDERPPRGTRFAPMGIGSYIGTFLLLCLPVANLILLIVWASGGCVNENKKNLARAILILYGACVLLALLLVALLGGFAAVTSIVGETEVAALCRLI